MGLAAVLKNREKLAGKRVLVVLCGANIDFLQLGLIAQSVGAANQASRTLRVRIPGAARCDAGVAGFMFRGNQHRGFPIREKRRDEAWPVFTITADDPAVLEGVPAKLDAGGFHGRI